MSLGLKDLRVKSLRTNDLTCRGALKIGLGHFRGSSWVDRRTSKLPQFRSLALRTAGLKPRDFDRLWGRDKESRRVGMQSSQTLRLKRRGSPSLEKGETLRQAQGRFWAPPVFLCQHLRTPRVKLAPEM